MKWMALLGCLLLAGCAALDQGAVATSVATAVIEGLKPLLDKLAAAAGMSPEEVGQLTEVLRKTATDATARAMDQHTTIDWETPAWALGSAIAAYWGVNLRRDMFRSARGEPTGKAKA